MTYESGDIYSGYSETSEQSVIGGLLIDSSRVAEVVELLTSDDFFILAHQHIFKAFEQLIESARPIDVTTVVASLDASKLLQEAGGLAYLAELAQNTPSAANVLAYAKGVKDKSNERQVLEISRSMMNEVQADEGSSEERINNALSLATNFTIEDKSEKSINEILKAVTYDIENKFKNKQISGVSSGFKKLDERFHGLQKKDLIVLAARPSMGKTTLAMNIAEDVATNGAEGAVLVFSLEMSAEQLIKKSLCSLGKIKMSNLRDGQLSDGEWSGLSKAMKKLKDSNMIIDDRPSLTVQQVRAKALKVKRKHGDIKLIVVDYLTLLKDKTARSRTEEVGSISRTLKAIAKECDVPVIALSQLNRKCEERSDKRPKMSDLRDSGEVEQDADIICFLYRDAVYNEQSEHPNVCELHTAKFRNGETGVDMLHASLASSRFEDLKHEVVFTEQKQKSGYKSRL